MKTRAAVLRDMGKDWEIIELELDPPREGEVLVRFAAAGLCHSDDHLRTGDIPVRYPIVGGHEIIMIIDLDSKESFMSFITQIKDLGMTKIRYHYVLATFVFYIF